MTSEEIRDISVTDFSERAWMKEIALQLALLNEKQVVPASVQQVMQRRK